MGFFRGNKQRLLSENIFIQTLPKRAMGDAQCCLLLIRFPMALHTKKICIKIYVFKILRPHHPSLWTWTRESLFKHMIKWSPFASLRCCIRERVECAACSVTERAFVPRMQFAIMGKLARIAYWLYFSHRAKKRNISARDTLSDARDESIMLSSNQVGGILHNFDEAVTCISPT